MRKTVMSEEIHLIFQNNESKKTARFHICGITFPDKHYTISRQSSTVSCIEYIEKGTGTVNIGNETFHPSEGDSYFLQSGYNQHYYSDAEAPWQKYFINFSGPLAEALTSIYGLDGIFHFKGLNLKNELCRIIELSKESGVDCSDKITIILHEIFLKLHNHVYLAVHRDDVAEEMRFFLDSRIEAPFRMHDLCRHVSKSESRAIKIFKKEYGVTPYQYVLGKKISQAKELLKNTNLSVKEIAARLSFADAYYFSNVFKQKRGVSPTEYRRLKQSLNTNEP